MIDQLQNLDLIKCLIETEGFNVQYNMWETKLVVYGYKRMFSIEQYNGVLYDPFDCFKYKYLSCWMSAFDCDIDDPLVLQRIQTFLNLINPICNISNLSHCIFTIANYPKKKGLLKLFYQDKWEQHNKKADVIWYHKSFT